MNLSPLVRPPRPEALAALAAGARGEPKAVARAAAEAIAAAEGFSLDEFRVFFAGSREVALSHLILTIVRSFSMRVNRRPRVVTVACDAAVELYCGVLRGEKALVWENPPVRGTGHPNFEAILNYINVALVILPAVMRTGVGPHYRGIAPKFAEKGIPLCLDLGECTGARRPPANPGQVAALVGGFGAAGGAGGLGFYAVRHEVIAGFTLRPPTILGGPNLAGMAAAEAALTAARAERTAACADAAKNAEAAAIFLKSNCRSVDVAQLGTDATLRVPRPCIAVLAINGRNPARAGGNAFNPNLTPTGPPPAPGVLTLAVLGNWRPPEKLQPLFSEFPRNRWQQPLNKFEIGAVRSVVFPADAQKAAQVIQAIAVALKPVVADGAPTRGRETAAMKNYRAARAEASAASSASKSHSKSRSKSHSKSRSKSRGAAKSPKPSRARSKSVKARSKSKSAKGRSKSRAKK